MDAFWAKLRPLIWWRPSGGMGRRSPSAGPTKSLGWWRRAPESMYGSTTLECWFAPMYTPYVSSAALYLIIAFPDMRSKRWIGARTIWPRVAGISLSRGIQTPVGVFWIPSASLKWKQFSAVLLDVGSSPPRLPRCAACFRARRASAACICCSKWPDGPMAASSVSAKTPGSLLALTRLMPTWPKKFHAVTAALRVIIEASAMLSSMGQRSRWILRTLFRLIWLHAPSCANVCSFSPMPTLTFIATTERGLFSQTHVAMPYS
mmetsp:Transcript_81012/g.229483  ORF Transcript_81012/g.229483 Transcript_81012/m.229483 type:complete len:262 (+) Transcript_81012:976-1761(+)